MVRLRPMVVTVVLRLLPGPLEAGELVGHAEVIATGAQVPIRRTSDLVAAARAAIGLPNDVEQHVPDRATDGTVEHDHHGATPLR